MKKALKIIGLLVLCPVVLFLLLVALFYFPPFQNWAVKQVAAVASEKTGMEITVDRVSLSFPLDLSVEGVKVVKMTDSLRLLKDTVADIRQTIVDVQFLPLLRAQVEVDALDIRTAHFNTSDLIASARVKGCFDALRVVSHGVNLSCETVMVNEAMLDGGDIDIQLTDSASEDTTKSETRWKIALQKLQVNRTAVRLSLSSDSLLVGGYLGRATVSDGLFDLGEGLFTVGRAEFSGTRINYDRPYEKPTAGFDYNHIAVSDVSLGVDSLSFQSPDLSLKVRRASFVEQSGLQLKSLVGTLRMDSTTLYVPSVTLETSESHLQANVTMDLNAFDSKSPGNLSVSARAQLGKDDVRLFLDGMPQQLWQQWPRYPLAIDCVANGNLRYMNIDRLEAELPTAFHASAKGYASNLTDLEHLIANLDISATTYNVAFLTSSFLSPSVAQTVRVPSGTTVRGKVFANGSNYNADLRLSQDGGWMTVRGKCNTRSMLYDAQIAADAFPLQQILPTMGVSPFSGKVTLAGNGTDVFSPKTRLDADVTIGSFRYADFDLSGTTATAHIKDGMIDADVNCVNRMVHGSVALDALMDLHKVRATIACSFDDADFYALKITDKPFNTSRCAHVDVASDLKDFFKVDGFVSDVVIRDSNAIYRPEELQVDITTRIDTTWAKINSGDMLLDLSASGGYKTLMSVTDNLMKELRRQIDRKYIVQDSIVRVFPTSHLVFRSGKNNMLARYAQHLKYSFREVNADLTTTPTEGLNGFVQADSLNLSGMKLDLIRLDLISDDEGFKYHAQARNDLSDPKMGFNALLDGSLLESGSDINLAIYDSQNYLGTKLGLQAVFTNNGIRVRLADTNAVLGYRKFTANDDNYIFIDDEKRVSANMKLLADDGTGLQLDSDDDNRDALQDVTLGINKLDLGNIVSMLPFFPKISGTLNGDFHAILTDEHLSVSTSMGIDSLVYEGNPMGNIATDFVYMPLENGTHYVDGMLMHNGRDVGTIAGRYHSQGSVLEADVDLKQVPLDWANGFVPNQVVALRGLADGKLKINGPFNALDIDGKVQFHDAYISSVPYGVELRFDDTPLTINNGRLQFADFNMQSHNNQQLTINGNIDLSDLDRMMLNLSLRARNFLIIDAKENRKSEVFGKTFVNITATMTGPLSAIAIRGRLDVLGSTDMTYIMRDTPLSTDNRLNELVTFVDIDDETVEVVNRPTIEGLSMDLTVSIDEGARIFCALNATKSNYLDLVGGGNLRLVYRADELRLNGRYTITNGEMKYSLPVIPLKTFIMQTGSYVEFTGEVTNPTLNITAVEESRTTVNDNGASRSVLFLCGVTITRTLKDMGLEFIISAPEDLSLNRELQSMSKEERGQIAVTMLTTGMYLTNNNTSSFTMNNALSSFRQKEINNITGNALRTIDLSIGLDNITDATGQLHTDYSFKFAKRFWNNRFNLVVGGRVSTNDAMNQSLFDNVSLEYRLDQSANTNIKLFYDRAKYDYLEGYVGQYGVGLVWKRKLQKLTDFFRFKTKRRSSGTRTKSAAADSLKTAADSLKMSTDSLKTPADSLDSTPKQAPPDDNPKRKSVK